MRKALGVFCLSMFSVVMVVGCGGNSVTAQNPSGQSVVPASLTIHDNPPAGVTVLNFEITVSGASLQPSDSSKAAVSMIQGPAEIELEHLQAESALLGNVNVPAGTYNGLSVTFANPKMTIVNQTATAVSLGSGQNCAAGQTCEFSPKLNQTMVTVQAPTAPFPINLTANSPVAFDLDFNVDTSLQASDLSITPSVSLKQVNLPDEKEMEGLHFVGRVLTIAQSNKTFTLQLGLSGQSQTIATDTNTKFNFQNSCTVNNLSCLAAGQIVKVEAQLPTSGTTPVAKQVELFAPEHELALAGLVSKVDVAKNQFQLVTRDVFDEGGQMQGIPSGVQVTVQIASQATFSINSDGLALPAGLNFASVSDMMVGQAVEFHPVAPFTVSGTQPNLSVTLSTDKVRLEPSPVTASISAINAGANPPNFMLGTLPAFFTAGGVSAIQVDVLSTTKFVNVSTGLAGLSTGNKVSVGGLLFHTGSAPTIVAERVFVRTP
jgi:Domain of unknown function (DUF4382)/Domain of unknown function (DUF5666)